MVAREREFQRQLIDVIVQEGFVYFIKLNSPLFYLITAFVLLKSCTAIAFMQKVKFEFIIGWQLSVGQNNSAKCVNSK